MDKIIDYLFKPRFYISRIQLNLLGVFFISIGLIAGIFVSLEGVRLISAATTPWTQTDWSGGAASGNVTGTVTTYESQTSLDSTTVTGNLSLNATDGWSSAYSSWNYRKNITVNNSGTELNNFQVQLNLDTQSIINASKMQSGCQDLRFSSSTGVELPFWIESGCNTSNTIVWVRLDLVSVGENIIDMYYGNQNASIASSGTNTFVFFDDFDTFDTNKWTSTGTSSINSGFLTITSGAVYTDQVAGSQPDAIVEAKVKWNNSVGNYSGLMIAGDQTIAGSNGGRDKLAMFMTNPSTTTVHSWGADGSATSYNITGGISQFTMTVGATYVLGFSLNSTHLQFFKDRVLTNQYSGTWSGDFYLWLGYFTGSTSATTDIEDIVADWVIVRKNASVLPITSSPSAEQSQFPPSGSLTSNILDAEFAADWGVLTYVSSGSGGVEVRVRSDVNADMSTATDWASCSAVSSGTDLSSTDCVTDTHQYLQYQVTLTPSGASSPVFEDISISFTASDQVDPTTNASSIAMSTALSGGRTVLVGGYNNTATPYFSWNTGADNPSGNGLKGYCVYLGTTEDSDPRTSAGLLTNSPIPSTGTDCGAGGFIVSSTSLNLATGSYLSSALESGTTYYVYVRAVDLAGNAFSGTNEAEFSFVQDGTAPINISYLSTPGFSFSNVVDMFFSWPTSGGSAASDEHSTVLGYQYQLNGTGDTWLGTQTDTTCDIDYIPNTDASYTLTLVQDGDNIVSGNNIVYFRSVDVACNFSSTATYRTGNLSYGGAAPSFGGDSVVTISPTTATANSFALSWPVASASAGQTVTHYYYMVNTPAPSTLATLQSNPATYLDNGTNLTVALAALPNVNKGVNTVRVVAIDDADTPNYSPSNVISGTFTLDSTDPDNVGNLVGSDSSIKSQEQWNVTLTWTEPVYQGAGNLTYLVYRSDDGTAFTQVGSTTGLSYVDNTPLSTLYYYKIYSRDGAQAVSSGSNAVSLTPTGKWTTPPSLESGPETSKITTKKATITWSTNRTSDSKVSYGTSSGNYYDEEPSNPAQVAAHTINLTNLSPGTTYYYKAKWTDEDGNTGESEEKTFSTSPAPTVIDPQVTNISISSALIQFTVSDASSIKLYYGPSTVFGGLQTISTSLDRGEYTISLSGLTDDTKYFFKINTFDQEDEEYEGSVLTFSTLPRPKISQVQIQQVTGTAQTTLLISWLTNTPVSSIVTYYPVANPEQARDEVNVTLKEGQHQTLLRGLLPDTNYGLIVKGIDKAGNQAVSDIQTLTTQTDTRPPQVSGMKVEGGVLPTASGAGQESTAQLVISWNTDEPATSQVEFGEGTGTTYSQKTQEDASLTVNHLVVISNLTPSKVYHVRAISKDKAGNEGVSIDTVTITPKATRNALDLVMTNLGVVFGFLGK